MNVTLEELRILAEDIKGARAAGVPYLAELSKPGTRLCYLGQLVPKERPRASKTGKMYTPERTRKFEASVAAWGRDYFYKPVAYPVRVELTVYDKTEDAFLIEASMKGLTASEHGDLDNYEKAICDALNGIAWSDDKKIISKETRRLYAYDPGFAITVTRAGLSKSELETLRRLVGAA